MGPVSLFCIVVSAETLESIWDSVTPKSSKQIQSIGLSAKRNDSSFSDMPTQNSFTSKSDSTSKIALVPSECPGMLLWVAIADAALPESSNSLQNDWLPEYV